MKDSHAKLGTTLPERIGKTPLVRLDQIVSGLDGITLLGKAEGAHPSGSGMDRAAAAIVRDAIARHRLTAGQTLLDAAGAHWPRWAQP